MLRTSHDPANPLVPPMDAGAPVVGGESYTIRLDRFEGPLDLLLYLIQRDEMDIYDIPIARITQQYLATIELLDVFNLDNAGDFLVMAATLMRIKARLLLPVQKGEEDEDEIDPRDELVRRLLEYKKFKEAAQSLGQHEEERADWFYRGSAFPYLDQAQEPPEFSLSLFDLLSAVRNVLERLEGDHTHHVFQETITVEQQVERILAQLAERERIRFEEIFDQARIKMHVVVTFVAMLELMKQQRIRAQQIVQYGDIWLVANREPEPEALQEDADAS
jgi:segregation and condensation protein A